MKAKLLTTISFAVCTLAATPPVYSQSVADGEAAAAAQASGAEQDISLCTELMQEFVTLLEGVHDNASAAAAAPRAKELFAQIDTLSNRLQKVVTEEDNADLFALDDRIFELADLLESQTEPWYGCQELADVFSDEEDETDYPEDHLTPEQEAYYSQAVESIHQDLSDIIKELNQVKDRASADAASKKVYISVLHLQGLLEDATGRDDRTDAVDAFLKQHFDSINQQIATIIDLLSELSDQEFYGSEDLEEALKSLAGD